MSGEDIELLYERLLVASGIRRLPGASGDPAAEPITEGERARLIALASRLALSDAPLDRTVAYEIATRLIEVTEDAPTVLGATDFLLARLGNFPGRHLLRARHPEAARMAAIPLALEEMAREIQNTVEVPGGESEPLTDFQRELLLAVRTRTSVSVSAPTSAGKSYVLSMEIVRRVIESTRREVVVYVVPTRALIRQVSLKLVRDFAAAEFLSVPVRSVPLAPDEPERSIVYVLTQERLLTLLETPEGCPEITLLIVDEAQGVGDGARGILLQSAVEQTLARFPEAGVLFAAPLVRNPEYLLGLFGRGAGARLLEEHSPVSQNVFLVSSVPKRPAAVEVAMLTGRRRLELGLRELAFDFGSLRVTERRARFAHAITGNEDSTLVYCNDPDEAETVARELAQLHAMNAQSAPLEEFIEFIQDHIHSEYPLIETLKHRVAFHYGDMPAIVRSRIEDLFADGTLRYVACTSTLLQGLNLPARHVVMEAPRRGPHQPMSRGDFLNMAGRAGRLLREFHGDVWCLQPERWRERSFEGEALQEVRAAFDEVMTSSPAVMIDALEGKAGGAARELGEASIGKAYARYTAHREPLPFTLEMSPQVIQTLADVDRRLAELRVTLPSSLLARNPTLMPDRLQALYDHIAIQRVEDCIPMLPYEPGWYDRLVTIFGVVDAFLEHRSSQRYLYFAMLAAKWVTGKSLARIIGDQVERKRGRDAGIEVSKAIREVLADIESGIRYGYVRKVKAYVDILSYVMTASGHTHDAKALKPLALSLECGTCDPVVMALLSSGLSRTTSLLARKLIHVSEGATPAECITAVKRLRLDRTSLPTLCAREVREVLGDYEMV